MRQHPGENAQADGPLRRHRTPRQLEALPRRVTQVRRVLRPGPERVSLHRGPEPRRLPTRDGLFVGVQGHSLEGEADLSHGGLRRRRHRARSRGGGGRGGVHGASRGQRGLLCRARRGRRRGGRGRRRDRGLLLRGINKFRVGGGVVRRLGFGREFVRASLPEELQRRRLELGGDRVHRIFNLVHGHRRQSARCLVLDALGLVVLAQSGRYLLFRRIGWLDSSHRDSCVGTAPGRCRRLRRLFLPLHHEFTLPSRERTFGTMLSLRERQPRAWGGGCRRGHRSAGPAPRGPLHHLADNLADLRGGIETMGGARTESIERRLRCLGGTHLGFSGRLRCADILGKHTREVLGGGILWGRTADAGYPRRGVRLVILRCEKRALKLQKLILRLFEVGTDPRELRHGAGLPSRASCVTQQSRPSRENF